MVIIDLDELKERNCGNCRHRNDKYKILGCSLLNKQTKKEKCCSLHLSDEENQGTDNKHSENEDLLDYPISDEKCKCGKPMYELPKRDDFFEDDEEYAYLCTDEDCNKKLIITVCKTCEHATTYWEE